MEFFQPVQRQNSFVYLKLAPATPSIKEVIHAVANYKNTAAQSLFSHPPTNKSKCNVTNRVTETAENKEQKAKKKERNEAQRWTQREKHVFSECEHVCTIRVTTNEETEDTFRRSKADFKADSLFLRYKSWKCPSI